MIYCKGKHCPNKKQCQRWIGHYENVKDRIVNECKNNSRGFIPWTNKNS